jgi:hypothetical protein
LNSFYESPPPMDSARGRDYSDKSTEHVRSENYANFKPPADIHANGTHRPEAPTLRLVVLGRQELNQIGADLVPRERIAAGIAKLRELLKPTTTTDWPNEGKRIEPALGPVEEREAKSTCFLPNRKHPARACSPMFTLVLKAIPRRWSHFRGAVMADTVGKAQ